MSEHERVPSIADAEAAQREAKQQEMRVAQSRAAEQRDGARVGYQEYDLLLRASPPRALTIFQQIVAIFVRLLGLGLLVIGIGTAVVVIFEVWNLYKEPVRMERFATAIEKGSNLDKIFALPAAVVSDVTQPAEGGEAAAEPVTSEYERPSHLRLSYFAAWFLVLLLLFVLSVVAVSAVSAGGRLALYDTDVRQLSRAVVKEIRRGRSSSKS